MIVYKAFKIPHPFFEYESVEGDQIKNPLLLLFPVFPIFQVKAEICPILSTLLCLVLSCIFNTFHLRFHSNTKAYLSQEWRSCPFSVPFPCFLRSLNPPKPVLKIGVSVLHRNKLRHVGYFVSKNLASVWVIYRIFITLDQCSFSISH